MSRMTEHEDFVILKNEIKKLRVELSMLLLERDELIFVECKYLEMKYLLYFGSLESKVYETRCIMLRLKRKIELMQRYINRQETIDHQEIEEILDREFEEFKETLKDHMEKIAEAHIYDQLEKLSNKEVQELKKKYHAIVKSLHPDLNPTIGEEEKHIFENAVRAYKNGDLQTIRIIFEMVETDTIENSQIGSFDQLKQERDRLAELIKRVYEYMQAVRTNFPYTEKELIEDEHRKENYRRQLQAIYQQYQEVIETYLERIQRMEEEYE